MCMRGAIMGQVTIYLEDELEEKMVAEAKSLHLSKSKWISSLIKDKIANEWPKSVIDLAGAWEDLPSIEELRLGIGKDADREGL